MESIVLEDIFNCLFILLKVTVFKAVRMLARCVIAILKNHSASDCSVADLYAMNTFSELFKVTSYVLESIELLLL